jgi:hypothetical protein
VALEASSSPWAVITTQDESDSAVNRAEWFCHAGGGNAASVSRTGDADFEWVKANIM